MVKRRKPSGRSQEAIKRASKRQQAKSVVRYLRLPRALDKALEAAANADNRTWTDWMRLNLPRLLPSNEVGPITPAWISRDTAAAMARAVLAVGESSDPPTGEKS